MEKRVIEFGPLAELIVGEACLPELGDIWQIAPAYNESLKTVYDLAIRRALERYTKNEEHSICTTTILRDYLGLVDEQCPPTTPHEIGMAFLLSGLVVRHVRELIDEAKARQIGSGIMQAVREHVGQPLPQEKEPGMFKQHGGVA